MPKYERRAAEDREAKRHLAEYVAGLGPLIGSNRGIFIESGTTTAQVALELLKSRHWSDSNRVYTNNVLVALAFVGERYGQQSQIVPGFIDREYPGIVGDSTVDALRQILPTCDVALLSTTSFDIETGPCANSPVNKEIKRTVLEYAKTVIICFSSRKLLRRDVPESVVSQDKWKEVLQSKNIHIVCGVTRSKEERIKIKERAQMMLQYLRRERINFHRETLVDEPDRVMHIHCQGALG